MIEGPPTGEIAVETVLRDIGSDDFGALSGLLLDTLVQVAGPGRTLAPASFGAQFTIAAFRGGAVRAVGRVERATRTLVFAEGEAHDASGVRLAVASGVFKVIE